jgi:hypothetical protein
VENISTRILQISDDGTLNTIKKESLPYYDHDCSGDSQSGSDIQIHAYNFWGLFVVAGLVSVIVLLFYMVRWKWDCSRIPAQTPLQSSSGQTAPQTSSGETPPQSSSGHGGGLELIQRFQFLRRTKSLNPNERRAISIRVFPELL